MVYDPRITSSSSPQSNSRAGQCTASTHSPRAAVERCRGMWLPAALLVAAVAAAGNLHESSISETQLVIKNLRKQLMRDNSDYSNELTKNTEIHRRADSELDKTLENITTNYYVTTKIYQPGAEDHHDSETEHVVEGNEYQTKPEIPVSEKDLLYYVDYEKLVSHKPEDRKYKTLEVGHQFRRSGRSQYIQEEGTEGVAILSLGRAPFPELRLPRARRQYRHERGRAASREEGLPPPPADGSDPPAAAEDAADASAASEAP